MKLFNKKTLTFLVAIICMTSAKAYDFEDDGIYYNILENNCVEVTHNNNRSSYYGDVIIPSSVSYMGTVYSVTTIGLQAFYVCDFMTSIVIPESVTAISKYAFYLCNSLTSIDIPNSVTSIGRYAFFVCPSLTSINVGQNNRYYTSVDGILYDKDITTLIYCPDNKDGNVIIPNSVTIIEDNAFNRCSSLTSIDIPNSVTSIGEYAFGECSSLTSIDIPNSVTSIGEHVFYDCTALTSIDIPNSVSSIGKYAFSGCSSLNSIYFPNSVTSIGEAAFSRCSSLTSIDIPTSVTSIGYGAFRGCSSLTSIYIPNSVTSIGESAFGICSSLTSINVEHNNRNYTSIDGVLYDKDITTLMCWPIRKSGNIDIPNSVTSIMNGAFQKCTTLTSIDIPNSVTSIGSYAFDNCTSLTSIKIPDSVTSIGMCGFSNCPLLTSVTCYSKRIPEIGYSCFSPISDFAVLSVYENLLEDYKKSEWAHYFSQISPISTSSINETVLDKENDTFSVYNLNGVKLLTTSNYDDLNNLPPTIYIINGKKVIIRK